MRPVTVFLTLSISANLALGFYLLNHNSTSRETTASQTSLIHETTPTHPINTPTIDSLSLEVVQAIPALLQDLSAGDLSSGIEQLRKMGLPEDTIRTFARAAILEKFNKMYLQLSGDDQGMVFYGGGYTLTPEQRERQKKFREMQKQLNEEARAAGVDMWGFYRGRTSNIGIPEEKAKQVAQLEQDRMEMTSNIQMDASGMLLDRDIEQMKYVEEEYKKDLATILTPEELEQWNLHRSQTAQTLRAKTAAMQPTEEEFKKLYALQAEFDEAWPSNVWGNGVDWQKRSEAEQELNNKISEALGPDRYAEYQKVSNNEYATLSNLEYRLELPEGTADHLYSLHKDTEQAANKIRSDQSLSDEDRKASLKVLVEQTKADMTQSLGEEGFKAYYNQNRWWLENISQ